MRRDQKGHKLRHFFRHTEAVGRNRLFQGGLVKSFHHVSLDKTGSNRIDRHIFAGYFLSQCLGGRQRGLFCARPGKTNRGIQADQPVEPAFRGRRVPSWQRAGENRKDKRKSCHSKQPSFQGSRRRIPRAMKIIRLPSDCGL